MNCGTILHDKEFQFSDGLTGNKLIIILSNYGRNYLVAVTTSQQHSKNRVKGCQLNDKPANYFIPKNSTWFEEDTWVLLNEVVEVDFDILSYKKEGRIALEKSVLPSTLMKDILNCALKSEDIEEFYLDFLKTVAESL